MPSLAPTGSRASSTRRASVRVNIWGGGAERTRGEGGEGERAGRGDRPHRRLLRRLGARAAYNPGRGVPSVPSLTRVRLALRVRLCVIIRALAQERTLAIARPPRPARPRNLIRLPPSTLLLAPYHNHIHVSPRLRPRPHDAPHRQARPARRGLRTAQAPQTALRLAPPREARRDPRHAHPAPDARDVRRPPAARAPRAPPLAPAGGGGGGGDPARDGVGVPAVHAC